MQTFTSPPAPPAAPAALPPAKARFPFASPLPLLLDTEVAPPLPVFATSPPIPPGPPAPPFAPFPPAPPAPPLQLLPAVPAAVVTGALTPVLAPPAIPPTPVPYPLFVAEMTAWQGFAKVCIGIIYKPITTNAPITEIIRLCLTIASNSECNY